MTHIRKLPMVVLISGSGTNLQAFIDAAANGDLPVDIRAVISNRAEAHGLERAQGAGIHTEVLSHRDFESRESYDAALMALIDRFEPGLVVLAGFMRILSSPFVSHYQGRLINIHPSLLPNYRGLHTHRRVLEEGGRHHGCSVHFVTPELDAGPVIVQARVAVNPDDSEETLAARVQAQEHRIYPLAVKWIAQGRIRLEEDAVYFDDRPLDTPPRVDAGEEVPA